MSIQTTRRLAAAAMASAAVLAIAGFTALGSVFDYPKILESPTAEILASYRRNQAAITAWFLVLVISAALLAPVGVLLGRLAGGKLGRWIAGIGVAAATVQVVGLSRWVLLIPRVSDDATVPSRTADAHHTFELLHTWLGKALGETIGYALTATFTVLVVIAITRAIAPRWMTFPLPLSTGEVDASLGYRHAQPVGVGADEVIGRCHPQRLPHFVVGRIGLAVAQVLGDRAGEQVAPLRHQAGRRPQLFGVVFANVDAVDTHRPTGDVIQSADQRYQCRLARTGGAHDGRCRAGRSCQRNIL